MLSILFIAVGVGLLAAGLYIFLTRGTDARRLAGGLSLGGAIAFGVGALVFTLQVGTKPAVTPPPPPRLVTEDRQPPPPKGDFGVKEAPREADSSVRERSPLAARLEGNGYTDFNAPIEFPPVPESPIYEEESGAPTYSMQDMAEIAAHLDQMDRRFANQLLEDEREWNTEWYRPDQKWQGVTMDYSNYAKKLKELAQRRKGPGTAPIRRDLFVLSKKYQLMANIYANHILTGKPLDEAKLRKTQRDIDMLRRRLAHYDPEAGTYVP